MGIDGGGIGVSCGFLENLRKRYDLSVGDICEVLVYLFVVEISYAVYYTKKIYCARGRSEESGEYLGEYCELNAKHYNFREVEMDEKSEKGPGLNIPFGYGFVSEKEAMEAE